MSNSPTTKLRSVAIIAHVDHGKTRWSTNCSRKRKHWHGAMLRPSALWTRKTKSASAVLPFWAKNTAIEWQGYHINIVDTPGHADFGGEVERVLSMVDGVLLLVDAVDGPMPQTRFVTAKAFARGLKPIVVVNKMDRPSARPDWVVDQVFDLFDHLGASDEQLDFPIIYSSALQGAASLTSEQLGDDMTPLLQAIIDHVPAPVVDSAGPLQMQISALDYDNYIGLLGIGRITRGQLTPNQTVVIKSADGNERRGRVLNVKRYLGMERIDTECALAGDIVCINGIDNLLIADTLCDPDHVEPLPPLTVDEPTVSMTFIVK